jgi:hypothetical protein
MQLTLQRNKVIVDMSYFIKSAIDEFKVKLKLKQLKPRAEPGKKNYFTLTQDAAALPDKQRKFFHSTTAKLLYLAKRARPDVLTVTSFLCTRVKAPTIEDLKKLVHTLGYLQATQQSTLILKLTKPMKIENYIDAAFAAHDDSKSHSGVALFVAGVLVYASSRKQKCVTKSPTESELVALTDNLGLKELFHEFVEFIMASLINKPVIYQDSTSVIQMATSGGGNIRMKLMRARMNLAREKVQQ